jgi:hypothetical protein
MADVLYGATAMGCLVAGLFFLRFWRASLDRLFLLFSLAFWILALAYSVRGVFPAATEWHLYVFGIRLVAFGLILYAIVDKNRH